MLRMIFVEFWPIIIPALLYVGYMLLIRSKARKNEEEIPAFLKGHMFWVAVATIIMGIICFVVLGMSKQPGDGHYKPATMNDSGKVTEGKVERE